MRYLLLSISIIIAVFPVPVRAADFSLSGATWQLAVSTPTGKGPFPAVILLPGCSGNWSRPVRAGLRAHTNALRRHGYAAAVLDVLGPRHMRSICASLSALNRYERAAADDAVASAQSLARHVQIDGKRIGFLGQSFGGSVALRLASARLRPRGVGIFRAIIAYYPWCADRYGTRPASSDFVPPVLILMGTADTWTPVERCRRLRPTPGSKTATIKVFRRAYHSFDAVGLQFQHIAGVGGLYPVGYSAAAARTSRRVYLDFLGRSLAR